MTNPRPDMILPDDLTGAFCHDNHAALVGQPTGMLAGLTFGVKDIFDIAGTRTGFGNPTWLSTHPPADTTAPAIQRLQLANEGSIKKILGLK